MDPNIIPPNPSEIIGFYSFKGGVGRSIAAAHIAYAFCRLKKRVLLVDADLEAPGLSFWNSNIYDKTELGLVHLLEILHQKDSANDVYTSLTSVNPQAVQIALANYIRKTNFFHWEHEHYPKQMAACEYDVHLLPAGIGTTSDSLNKYVGILNDAQKTFTHSISQLRHCLRYSGYDVVLVDSRTGLHNIAAAIFSVLSDHHVVFFGPGRQNYHGFFTALEVLSPKQIENSVFAMSPVAWGNAHRFEKAELLLKNKMNESKNIIPPKITTISWHPSLAQDEHLITVTDPRSSTARNFQELFIQIQNNRGEGIDRFTRRVDSLLDIYKRSISVGSSGNEEGGYGLRDFKLVCTDELRDAFSDALKAELDILADYINELSPEEWKTWHTRAIFIRFILWEMVRCFNNLSELDIEAAEVLWDLIIRRNMEKKADDRLARLYAQLPGSEELKYLRQILHYHYREKFGRGLSNIDPAPPAPDRYMMEEIKLSTFLMTVPKNTGAKS